MDNLLERGCDAWRLLDGGWRQVQAQWRGITYERFAAQFWDQLDEETRDYLRALERLGDVLAEIESLAL